jgi:hypothetical protein
MPKEKSKKKVVKLRHEPLNKQIEKKNGILKAPKMNKSSNNKDSSEDVDINIEDYEEVPKSLKTGNKSLSSNDDNRWLNDDNDDNNNSDNDINDTNNDDEDDEEEEEEEEEYDDDDDDGEGDNIVKLDGDNFTPSGVTESEVITHMQHLYYYWCVCLCVCVCLCLCPCVFCTVPSFFSDVTKICPKKLWYTKKVVHTLLAVQK